MSNDIIEMCSEHELQLIGKSVHTNAGDGTQPVSGVISRINDDGTVKINLNRDQSIAGKFGTANTLETASKYSGTLSQATGLPETEIEDQAWWIPFYDSESGVLMAIPHGFRMREIPAVGEIVEQLGEIIEDLQEEIDDADELDEDELEEDDELDDDEDLDLEDEEPDATELHS